MASELAPAGWRVLGDWLRRPCASREEMRLISPDSNSIVSSENYHHHHPPSSLCNPPSDPPFLSKAIIIDRSLSRSIHIGRL
jgi:hypothetical protein